MSLRERRREHTEQMILEAATLAFAAGGFHGTSMDDIAREVDCAPATLYGYFKGKTELFARLLADRTAVYMSGLLTAVEASEGFEGGLDAFLDHWVAYSQEHEAFLRILVDLMMTGGSGHAPEPAQMEAVRRSYLGLIGQIMERGVDEGALSVQDPGLLAEALLGMTHSLTFAWLHGQGPGGIDSNISLVRHIFLRGAACVGDGEQR